MISSLIRSAACCVPPVSKIIQEREESNAALDRERRQTAYRHGHFYSAIPSSEDVGQRFRELEGRDLSDIPGVDLNSAEQLRWCERVAKFYGELPFEEQPADELRYYFDNQTFVWADAVFLYGMLRALRPRRIVEVGSGFSSALMLDVNDRFLQGEVALTFVEPYPDRLYGLLRATDEGRCTVVEKRVQDVDDKTWGKLESGDILFIDSSHVSKCGSDVNRIYFDIIPSIKPGVIVHIHDIFPHFEYPETWLREKRFWNENYLLRSFLQFNSEFEILLWGPYAVSQHAEFIRDKMPLCLRDPGGSLWMRRKCNEDIR